MGNMIWVASRNNHNDRNENEQSIMTRPWQGSWSQEILEEKWLIFSFSPWLSRFSRKLSYSPLDIWDFVPCFSSWSTFWFDFAFVTPDPLPSSSSTRRVTLVNRIVWGLGQALTHKDYRRGKFLEARMKKFRFLDAIASPSTYPGRSVSEWLMFSDFGDCYRIYRACELVLNSERMY